MKPAASHASKDQLAAIVGGASPDINERKLAMLPGIRTWLAALRESQKAAFMESGDATALVTAHAHAIDTLLAVLFEAYCAGKPMPVAVVATGGYGREELFPYSDIDLLFLHDGRDAAQAAGVAEFLLYMLWDLGFKVGQAHRSIKEAVALSREDLTIRTSLLDARLVCGSADVFAKFSTRFEQELQSSPPLEFVEAKLAERDSRHLRFGDSRYMLEPNVKEGKGGLRDLHTLWWMARCAYPIHALKDLVKMGLLTREEYRMCDRAGQFLCKVRAHLHYLADHAEERIAFDRQHALAEAMGYAHPSPNRAVERFMRRYFAAVRMVGTATRIICALLEDQNKRKPHKSLTWLWHSPWKLGGFKLDGQRLAVRNDQVFEQNPLLMLELFRTAQLHELDIHPRTLQLLTRSLPSVGSELQNDPKACAIFMDILTDSKDAEITLRKMSEAGLLGRFIPDFGRVIGQTQFNLYHVFTVDEHTLVAIGILHALANGKLKHELPLASEVASRVQMKRVLYLALFCHDIAKGRGGDHSELGEKIVIRLAKRFGFSADETQTAAWLVRDHLLFSNTSLKRDINDPKTIQDFIAVVRSSERLKLLFALTIADIRAVSPTVWNAWKGSLLDELYTLAEQAIGTGKVELKQHQTGQFTKELQKLLPEWTAADVTAYVEQGNAAFWTSCDLLHHASIARMLREAAHAASPLVIGTEHDYERRVTSITVCAPDQHGLFSQLSGALALSGANIIGAKIFTLKGSMAVDVFQVQDAAGDVFDRADKLAKMSVYIEQSLSGELNIPQAFASRRREFGSVRRSALATPGQVFIENDASNLYTVIEITGHDRTGFLYHITQAIADLGLSIVTAHISTYGTQIADVFYVKDIFGMKISHDAKIRQIRNALLDIVNSPASA